MPCIPSCVVSQYGYPGGYYLHTQMQNIFCKSAVCLVALKNWSRCGWHCFPFCFFLPWTLITVCVSSELSSYCHFSQISYIHFCLDFIWEIWRHEYAYTIPYPVVIPHFKDVLRCGCSW
jgi:hypothetical protein